MYGLTMGMDTKPVKILLVVSNFVMQDVTYYTKIVVFGKFEFKLKYLMSVLQNEMVKQQTFPFAES